MIHESRITQLNDAPVRADGDCVVYWMQQSQRARCNHALEYAIERANALGLPVIVCFGLTPSYPEATARHYRFMIEGLARTGAELARRGIPLAVEIGEPPAAALRWSQRAALLVADRGYLRTQRAWRAECAAAARCPVVQVESDVVVPLAVASDHHEYAAATLRPKIMRALPAFLHPLRARRPRHRWRGDLPAASDLPEPAALEQRLGVAPSPGPVAGLQGGTAAARRRLARFIRHDLDRYAAERSDPGRSCQSGLSPYLHFGQISPLEIALAVLATDSPGRDAFLEELIVRRELAMNHVWYREDYDRYECVPSWARDTLARHAADARPYVYPLEDLTAARTHDEAWNAAQRELVNTGAMHNYMRMYWAKKILEWSPGPEEAFRRALWLNNTYAVDGRDASSYTGVAWCFGLHDRPWGERAVFGTVRSMTAAGLARKFDMAAYLKRMAPR